MSLSKPTNGGTDYVSRIGALFDKWNDGNYEFPATQVPSADPNTLDDYEEGTWTPSLSLATPGDLTVAYSTRGGEYTKIGRDVFLTLLILTSTFTHTTASGIAAVSGWPFTTNGDGGHEWNGQLKWQGITKANYTDMCLYLPNGVATANVVASGSGQSNSTVTASDMPTAGTVRLMGEIFHRV